MPRSLLLLLSLLAAPAVAASGDGGRAGKLLRNIDADGNGMISRAEARASPALSADFDVIDANRDGQITPDELRAWNRGRGTRAYGTGGTGGKSGKSGKGGLDEQFSSADKNGDGVLSRDEAEKGLRRVASRFDEIDTNRDGRITREELRSYLRARRELKSGKSGPQNKP